MNADSNTLPAACLLCGSKHGRHILTARSMELWRCAACDLVQRSPLPSATEIDALYAGDAHYGDELRQSEAEFLARERTLLEDLAAKGVRGPLLDVGAGAGYILRAGLERGWSVEGIELSRPNAERIAAELGVRVHNVDFSAAPLEPGTFGLITFSHSLEHLPDPVGALRRARELLAPGGHIHIAVPHWNAAKRRVAGGRIAWIYPHHLVYFTARTLTRALKAAGLSVEHRDTRPMLGRDYPFLFACLRRAGLAGPAARFLGLAKAPLESLLRNNLELPVPPWRLKAALCVAHGFLRLWPERTLGHVGLGEELRITARTKP